MHKQAARLQVPALKHQAPCFTPRLPPRARGGSASVAVLLEYSAGLSQAAQPQPPPHPLLSGIYYCLSATMGQALCQEPGTQR